MTNTPLNVPTPPHMDEDELRLFATSVGRFLDEHAGPDKRQQWREDRVVERALWHKAGAAGLLGLSTDAAYGGVGGDFRHEVVLMEEIGRPA